jgi:phage terminase small subunit
MALNARQQRFVEEYLIDLNATQAAIRAGYSAATANSIGPKLLVNIGIQAALQSAQALRSERTQITADKVLTDIELIKLDAMRFDGEKMINHAAALKACELQGKNLKMFVDKVEHSGGQTLQVITGVDASD